VPHSESGLGAASRARAKGFKNARAGGAWRGRGCDMSGRKETRNVVRECCWDESVLETELFIGIAQLALCSGTR
jgi:hypothetical protein